jgi:Pregnancy-associated plasma protein-A
MFNKLTLLVSVFLCLSCITYAQLQPCSTDEQYHKLLIQYPQLADYEEQFESQLKEKIGHKTTATDDTTFYDVPIVVHVVHDYGVENINDDALYTAAAYWATIYVKQYPDTIDVIPPFIPYIGNPRMRLHLATIDPNGKPTKGIVRFNSYLTKGGDDQAKFEQWPPNMYINIWIVNGFSAANAGAAAYAQPPFIFPYAPFYDGIICLYSYTNPTTMTIPHEMGHVMNLKHTWGNTNSAGVACGDDNVDDTPPTKGHNPSFCAPAALYDTVCAMNYSKTYFSVLSGLVDSLVDYPDTTNAQNIMDYTYCDKMFTKGQCVRMRAALTSPTAGRNNLITPANLAATGALAPMPDLPPVADFVVNRATGAVGVVTDTRTRFMTFNNSCGFQFRNASWNDTVWDVQWIFSNGATTPTATSMTTVDNKFSTPGWVTVQLIANSNAGSDTFTNANAVYAADTTSAGGLSYAQHFSNAGDIANWPMFNYYNNQFRWEYYYGAGLGDSSCIRYHSFDTSGRVTGIAIGDHDDIFTPAFNLADATGTVYLNFYTAGAYTTHGIGTYDPRQQDSLQVDVSINGGIQWVKIAGFRTTDLENNGNSGTEFVPTSPDQWKGRAVTVPPAYFTNNTFFRFRYWPGNMGNDLYLDNFTLSPYTVGVKEIVSSGSAFSIFPNPSANGCKLAFKTGNDGTVNYCIKDLTGKVMYSVSKEFAPNTIGEEDITRSLTPAAGMYFVTLTIDGVNMTQKLVVY